MMYLGDFAAGATVRVPWHTTAADGSSVTRATNGSIRIYKDNSTTQRASASGITDSEDFDSLAGVHHVNIDLSDNADAGFYAAAHDYFVVLEGAVIDGVTVNAVLGSFSIQNRYYGAVGGASVADIADGVWDEATAGHVTAGTTGKALGDVLANHASLAATLALIKAVTDLLTSAQSEPAAVPAANATPLAKLAWVAALHRNKITQTATQQKIYADDATTVIGTAGVGDDGTVFTRGEFG